MNSEPLDARPKAVSLDANLDLPAATELTRTLEALCGRPVEIDASDVTHLGALCAQVLAAAAARWRADAVSFAIVHASEQYVACVKLLGMQSLLLEMESVL